MAKTENRISVNTFEKIMREHFTPVVTVKWHEAEITVKRSLSLVEMMEFAQSVAESCFDETRGFVPELADFVIRSNILEMYGNFRLPEDLKKRYELLYNTDAVETVMANANRQQLQELVDAIDRKIRYLCDTRVNELSARFRDVAQAMEAMSKSAGEVFEGVTADDLKKLIRAVGEHGKIDEEKIVKAVLEHKAGASAKEPGTDER